MNTPRPSATISTALFVPQDRIARVPLAGWAGRLRDTLAACRRELRGVRAYATAVTEVCNNTGLIAASHGARAKARRICERQTWWASRLARRSGNAQVAFSAAWSWVNLGRLDALDGDWRSAVGRFAVLRDFGRDDEMRMGALRVDGRQWRGAEEARRAYARELDQIHVLESLKALLMTRRFEEARAFAAEVPPGHPESGCAREASVVAACASGDFDAALGAAREGSRSRGWDGVVFRMRIGETLACAGEPSRAAAVLAPLADTVRRVAPGRKNLYGLHVSLRLAAACQEAGLDAEAWEIARDAYEGARGQDDEVFQIESLRLLASTSAASERPCWEAVLRAAEDATEYARFRRGGPPPVHPVIGGLCEEVEAVLDA